MEMDDQLIKGFKAIEGRWRIHEKKLREIEEKSMMKGYESEYYSMKRQDLHDVQYLLSRLRYFEECETHYHRSINGLKQTIENMKHDFKSLDRRED